MVDVLDPVQLERVDDQMEPIGEFCLDFDRFCRFARHSLPPKTAGLSDRCRVLPDCRFYRCPRTPHVVVEPHCMFAH